MARDNNVTRRTNNGLQRQRLVEILAQVALQVTEAETPEEVYRVVYRALRAAGVKCLTGFIEYDNQTLRFVFGTEVPSVVKELEALLSVRAIDIRLAIDPVFTRCVRDRRPTFIADAPRAMRQALPENLRGAVPEIVRLLGFQQAIVAPMVVGDRVLGIMIFYGEELDQADTPVVAMFAAYVAMTVARAELVASARDAEVRYRELFEAATDGIFYMDLRGNVLTSNPTADQIFGRALGAERVTLDSLFDAPAVTLVRERLWAASVGEAASVEVSFRRPDGQRRELSLRFAPIHRGEEITGIHGWVRDVTEEKQLAQALSRAEQFRALGQLAAGVAHDFNNVLAGILGNAQLLLSSVDDEKVVERLRMIERAALDGAEVVRRIIQFTQPESIQPFEVVDVEGLLNEVLAATRRRWHDEARTRGINIEVRVEAEGVPPVMGNPSELREALVNLVLNAVEAMPEGGRLTLAAAEDGGQVRIEVHDTGVGMDEESVQRAMEPFYTTKGPTQSGLGLSVSYGIISRHKGRFELHSTPGKGTTCLIWLPKASEEEIERAAPPEIPSRTGRVLVVEDEEIVREMLATTLRLAGHEVTEVASGEEALQALTERRFDVVVTDIAMPGVSGWEVASAAREREEPIPVIFVTGWAASVDRNRARKMGVRRILAKPTTTEELLEAVREALGETSEQ